MAHLRDMLLWVALIAFAMTVGDVMAYGGGNCTTILAHPVYLHAPSGAMVLIHNGKAGTLSSSINGVIPDGAFNVTIAVTALMERLRSDGSNGDRCYVPRTFHSPYETEDSNGHIYAPYVSNFTMADFDCYIYNYSYVKEGVTIYALTSKSSLHSDPTFHALVTYEFPTESLTVYPSQNTTYTYGIPYANSWTKDQLKITLEFINFPWVDDLASVNSSSSFISAHFLTSVNLPAGLGYFRTTSDSVQFSFNTSSSPKQSLFFEFEACWLVDGVPICSRGDDVANSFPLTVPDGAQYNYAIPMGVPLCSSAVGHWQHSIYDPQMSILFDADPTDSITTPATPTAAKQRQIVKIVAPVVVVGVVLLAVIFIVVVFNTPSLKAKFMPSRVETDAFDEPRSSASHSYAPSTPASATPTSPSVQSTSQSPTSTKAQKKAWKQSVRPTV